MSNISDVFGLQSEAPRNRWHQIGPPSNPFMGPEDADGYEAAPLYRGHIKNELLAGQQWLSDVHTAGARQPLPIGGNIGAGKRPTLRKIRHAIAQWPPEEKAVAQIELLTDTGYS